MLRGCAILAMLVVLAAAVLVGSLWLDHRTATTLPAPTGSFAVGRAIEDWKGDERELLLWIWYPAEAGPSAATNDYLPPFLRTEVERARSSPIIKLLTRDLSKVHTNSLRNASLSPRERSYPVVILRAGASAPVWNYSTLAEDLASHGYVVVGFDAPYRTGIVVFPDGRVMTRTPENNPELCLARVGQERDRCVNRVLSAWTSDIGFVLDRLGRWNSGRLDMTRVGVLGHSFGGATALQFCHDDARCKAGIDLDGAPQGSVIQSGLRQPFMFLLSDHRGEDDPESRRIKADIRSIYDRLPADGRVCISIRGANHFLFNDDLALFKSHIVMRALRLFGILHIDGRRQLAVTADCIHRFFDAYLEGATRFATPSDAISCTP